jgi:hypothetical protein
LSLHDCIIDVLFCVVCDELLNCRGVACNALCAVNPMADYHPHVVVVGADLRVCPCATMVALQCNAAYCAYRGKICGVSLQMGVAGNAPTVVAVIANGAKHRRKTWQNIMAKRADTQVCPYENRRNTQKTLDKPAKNFYIYPQMRHFTQKTPLARPSHIGSVAQLCNFTPPPPPPHNPPLTLH